MYSPFMASENAPAKAYIDAYLSAASNILSLHVKDTLKNYVHVGIQSFLN